MSETIKLRYRETHDLMYTGGDSDYNYMVPDSPFKEATFVSSERHGWMKVITDDGQLETINERQVFYVKHGRKKWADRTGEKYDYLPLWLGKKRILFNCVAWQILMFLFINGFVMWAVPDWSWYWLFFFTIGLIFNGLLVGSFFEYLKTYKVIVHFKNADPNYRNKGEKK